MAYDVFKEVIEQEMNIAGIKRKKPKWIKKFWRFKFRTNRTINKNKRYRSFIPKC